MLYLLEYEHEHEQFENPDYCYRLYQQNLPEYGHEQAADPDYCYRLLTTKCRNRINSANSTRLLKSPHNQHLAYFQRLNYYYLLNLFVS